MSKLIKLYTVMCSLVYIIVPQQSYKIKKEGMDYEHCILVFMSLPVVNDKEETRANDSRHLL